MKNKTIKKVLMAFGMTILSVISAFGQSQNRQERKKPPTFEELIEDMDANKDGKLSEDEIRGRLKKDFAKIDIDEDGFITEEEFKKAPKPKRKERRN